MREWLNALTVGRVVEYQPSDKIYSLLAEHAAFLTRATKADNISVFFQHVPGLGVMEDEVIYCFVNVGGMFAVPGLVKRLTEGINVLDVRCGRGRAIAKLAKLFPASKDDNQPIIFVS